MKKTKFKNDADALMITTEQLMSKLNCGYKSAVQIGTEAKARIYVGRRVWYNVSKIEKYLEQNAV